MLCDALRMFAIVLHSYFTCFYTIGYPITGLEKIKELNMESAVTVYIAGATISSSTNTGRASTTSTETIKTMEGSADTMLLKTVTTTPTRTTTDASTAVNTSTTATNIPTNISTNSSCIPVTSGGRVLAVTGLGNTLRSAVENAYQGVKVVHFQGMHYRTDIAKR